MSIEHHFVSCYFYDQVENPVRKELKNQFVARYAWVTLLEKNGEPGFVDYKMINQYLSLIDKNSLKSLTVLDCDLILEDFFRAAVISKIYDGYDLIHGFDESYELVDGIIDYNEMVRGVTFNKCGHTGYCWTFSKKFLQSIKYKFPENFLFGGFDFILGCNFIRLKNDDFFDQLFGNSDTRKQMIGEFIEQTKNIKAVTWLEHAIIHNYHGSKVNRLTNFKLYSDPNYPLRKIMEHRDKWE